MPKVRFLRGVKLRRGRQRGLTDLGPVRNDVEKMQAQADQGLLRFLSLQESMPNYCSLGGQRTTEAKSITEKIVCFGFFPHLWQADYRAVRLIVGRTPVNS